MNDDWELPEGREFETIEYNWDPEARHDAGSLTIRQIAWLIDEVRKYRQARG